MRIFFLLTFFVSIHGQEYLYPVAWCEREGQRYIYLFYQKSTSHTELWEWNPDTRIAHKALLSSFIPAALRILPDNEGFSFIDNGRLKIKYFEKNTVRAIDIYEPIYDINAVEWLDADTFYLSAKEDNHCFIYQGILKGEVIKIVGNNNISDCLYPQIKDGQLFFIERAQVDDRTTRYIFEIKQINVNEKTSAQSIMRWGCSGHEAIAFLHMESAHEGFFIEHPSHIDKQDKTIPFSYHRFEKTLLGWQTTFLFSFELPLDLLVPGSSCLYESMLPLLPRHCGNLIYFMDCAQSYENKISVYTYHLDSQNITQHAKTEQHIFSPLIINNTVYCGGTLDNENPPCMKINAQGEMIIELLN